MLLIGRVHAPLIFDHEPIHFLIVEEEHIEIVISVLESMIPAIELFAEDIAESLNRILAIAKDDSHNVYLHTLLKYPEAILPSYFTNIIYE